MKEYYIIEERYHGDSFERRCDNQTPDGAIEETKRAWAFLSKHDKKGERMQLVLADVDEDGCVDFESIRDILWDSEKVEEE